MKTVATVVVALALALGACATVAPWQRERLAARGMRLDADPLGDELAEHVHEVREGASGGAAGGGGGCGCN